MQSANIDINPLPEFSKGVIATYKSHDDAEAAVKELQHSSFDMTKLSIVARGAYVDEHVIGYYHTGDRMKYWGKLGALWGGISGMLFGTGLFLIPGAGPILVAGPLVSWIVGALEGAVMIGGASAIGAGLFSIGIPKNSILKYDSALKSGQYLVIVHGTEDDVRTAKNIILSTTPESVDEHHLEPVAAQASKKGS